MRSTGLLAAVLPALALPLTAPPDEPGGEVDDARAGLERLVDAYADWPAARQLPECPLIERDEINTALETAGIDSALPEWELQVSSELPGVECFGGNEETSVFLYVADFGSSDAFQQVIGAAFPEGLDEQTLSSSIGPTVGSCSTGASECTEFWERDGFTIGVRIEDAVFVDGPTTATVLIDVLPGVLPAVARGATDVADPLMAIDADAVAAAAAGIDAVIGSPTPATVRPSIAGTWTSS